MSPNKRVFLSLAAFAIVLVTLACSCGSLGAATPSDRAATSAPSGGAATSIPVQGGETIGPIPGMEGSWEDMKTYNTYSIVFKNNTYQIYVGINANATSYTGANITWSQDSLTWTYSVPSGTMFTLTTTSLSGDSLTVNWSGSDGSSGTMVLTRVGN